MNVIVLMEAVIKLALISLAPILVPAKQDLFLIMMITTAQVYCSHTFNYVMVSRYQ